MILGLKNILKEHVSTDIVNIIIDMKNNIEIWENTKSNWNEVNSQMCFIINHRNHPSRLLSLRLSFYLVNLN